MTNCAEWVSIGHPDKTADAIASYLLDEYIKHDSKVRFALEVQLKDHVCNLAGEVTSTWQPTSDEIEFHVKEAIRKVGYTAEYAARWPDGATLNADNVVVNNFIGQQSPNIAQGVDANGWGDQGAMMGMATNEEDYDYLPRDVYFSRKIGKKLYEAAKNMTEPIGLDIKTLVSIKGGLNVEQVIVAAPIVPGKEVEAEKFIKKTVRDVLGERHHTCDELIINGTGSYVIHSSVGDAGVVGRKLAVDFYGLNCPIGGGCVDAETEYLSPDGWQRFDSYRGGLVAQVNASHSISFVNPEQYIETIHDDVYEFGTTNTISMVLSGNHNVYYRTRKKNFIKKTVKDILRLYAKSVHGPHIEIPLTFSYDFNGGVRKFDNEYMIRFLVAHCAYGTVMHQGDKCRIRVNKQREIDLLRDYLPRTGLEWKERHYSDGYTYFYYNLQNKSKLLHEQFSNPDLYTARILSEEVFKWDGDEDRMIFRTTNEDDANFIQFVLVAVLGKSASILKHKRHKGCTDKDSPMFGVYVSDRIFATPFRKGGKNKVGRNIMRKCHPQVMYCFTVPSGLLLVRRKGHIFVTGNSPWGKDATKADVTLNLVARYLSLMTMLQNPGKYQKIFTKISCCIGRSKCLIVQMDENGNAIEKRNVELLPSKFIEMFGLNGVKHTDMFFSMNANGLFTQVDEVALQEAKKIQDKGKRGCRTCEVKSQQEGD